MIDSSNTVLNGCRYYYAPSNTNTTSWRSYLTAGKTYYFRISGMFNDLGKYSLSIGSTQYANIASGNWHDPGIWNNNKVPDNESDVTLTYPVTVSADGICKTLTVTNNVQVTVQTGVNLTVLSQPSLTFPPAAALKFDGVNDMIAIPHNSLLKPSAGITIEAWVRPTDIHSTVYSEIYRKEDGDARHLLSFQNNGTILSFGLGVNGVYSELDVPITLNDYEGKWVHIAATFNGTVKRIYRNNILIGSQNVTGSISTFGTAPAYIGSFLGNSEFFNGAIDEFRLWDRAIQVESKLNCEIPYPVPGLLLYYKFNQGTSGLSNPLVRTAIDASGNGITGNLIGFSLTGSNSNWIAPGGVQAGFSCTPPF